MTKYKFIDNEHKIEKLNHYLEYNLLVKIERGYFDRKNKKYIPFIKEDYDRKNILIIYGYEDIINYLLDKNWIDAEFIRIYINKIFSNMNTYSSWNDSSKEKIKILRYYMNIPKNNHRFEQIITINDILNTQNSNKSVIFNCKYREKSDLKLIKFLYEEVGVPRDFFVNSKKDGLIYSAIEYGNIYTIIYLSNRIFNINDLKQIKLDKIKKSICCNSNTKFNKCKEYIKNYNEHKLKYKNITDAIKFKPFLGIEFYKQMEEMSEYNKII